MGDERQYQGKSAIKYSEHSRGGLQRAPVKPSFDKETELKMKERRLQILKELWPEFLPVLKDAFDNNMIAGWRDVRVNVIRKNENKADE